MNLHWKWKYENPKARSPEVSKWSGDHDFKVQIFSYFSWFIILGREMFFSMNLSWFFQPLSILFITKASLTADLDESETGFHWYIWHFSGPPMSLESNKTPTVLSWYVWQKWFTKSTPKLIVGLSLHCLFYLPLNDAAYSFHLPLARFDFLFCCGFYFLLLTPILPFLGSNNSSERVRKKVDWTLRSVDALLQPIFHPLTPISPLAKSQSESISRWRVEVFRIFVS